MGDEFDSFFDISEEDESIQLEIDQRVEEVSTAIFGYFLQFKWSQSHLCLCRSHMTNTILKFWHIYAFLDKCLVST